jgi:hypothetical protein
VAPPGYYPPAYPPPQPPFGDPIDYRNTGYGGSRYEVGRPGIISAMAITGIVVAVLSFVGSLFTGCSAVVTMTNANRTVAFARGGAAAAAVTTAAPPPPPAPAADPAAADTGLRAPDRAVVVAAMRNRMRAGPLSAPRERQVHAFLAQHGKSVLDPPGGALTHKRVFDHLGEVGKEYATGGQAPADFFVFKAGPACKNPGRLRVFDDRTVFEPDDRGETLRATAPKDAAGDPSATGNPTHPFDPGTGPTPLAAGLGDDEARAVVSRVRQLSNGRLNGAQATTLMGLLQSSAAGGLLTPSGTIPGYTAQVRSAAAQANGTVAVTFGMGDVTMDAQGNLTHALPPPVAATPATTGPTGPQFVMGSLGVRKPDCTLAIIDAGLGVLLAIFLLVIAILTLRQSAGTRRLYVIYAVVKIASGVAAIVAFASIVSAIRATTQTGNTAIIMGGYFESISRTSLVLTAIGLAFPIGVLATLAFSRQAREYYRTTG